LIFCFLYHKFSFVLFLFVYLLVLFVLLSLCFLVFTCQLISNVLLKVSNRSANSLFDRDLHRETHFDIDELGRFVQTILPNLVTEYRIAYVRIMHAITSKSGGLYFLDTSGVRRHRQKFSHFLLPYDYDMKLHWQSHHQELQKLF